MYFEHYYPNVTDREAILVKRHGRMLRPLNFSFSAYLVCANTGYRALPQHSAPKRSVYPRSQHNPHAMGRDVSLNQKYDPILKKQPFWPANFDKAH